MLENCFIDELLKANDNILLKAEGMIVETLKPNFLFNSTFTNKSTAQKPSNVQIN